MKKILMASTKRRKVWFQFFVKILQELKKYVTKSMSMYLLFKIFFLWKKSIIIIVYHHPLIYFLTIIIYILYRNFSSIRVRNQVRIEFVSAWIVLFKYFFFGGKCLKLIFEIFEKKNEISVMIFLHALKL